MQRIPLPKYSPDYNPIELCFNDIKKQIKKFNGDYILDKAIQRVIPIVSLNCGGYYEKLKFNLKNFKNKNLLQQEN